MNNPYEIIFDVLKSCKSREENYNHYRTLNSISKALVESTLSTIYDVVNFTEEENVLYRFVRIANRNYHIIIPLLSFNKRNIGYKLSKNVNKIIKPVILSIPLSYSAEENNLFIYPYNIDIEKDSEDEYNVINNILTYFTVNILKYNNSIDNLISSIISYSLFRHVDYLAYKSLEEFSEAIIYIINLDQYPINKTYYIFDDKKEEVCNICKNTLDNIMDNGSFGNITELYGLITGCGVLFKDIIELYEGKESES